MIKVRLTPREMAHADGVYADWQEMNRDTAKPKYGAAKNLVTPHSIHAQMAVAKFTNLYHYENTGDYDAVDVGEQVEVRSITQADHRLILHPSDKDYLPFVLVLVQAPDFYLLGWLIARVGKRKEFWTDPVGGRPAWFVPQRCLAQMETLLNYLHPSDQRKEVA